MPLSQKFGTLSSLLCNPSLRSKGVPNFWMEATYGLWEYFWGYFWGHIWALWPQFTMWIKFQGIFISEKMTLSTLSSLLCNLQKASQRWALDLVSSTEVKTNKFVISPKNRRRHNSYHNLFCDTIFCGWRKKGEIHCSDRGAPQFISRISISNLCLTYQNLDKSWKNSARLLTVADLRFKY